MAQPRRNSKRGNVPAGRRVDSSKPSKRDFCAHVWQFVHYVEDFMSGKTNFHKPTCRIKCDQVKDMLRELEG